MTTTWADSATLEQLRALPDLVYRAFTVIQPMGGVDGSLQDPDGKVSYPLDLRTPAEFRPPTRTRKATWVEDAALAWTTGQVLSVHEDHGVLLPAEEMSPVIVREAVARWCRVHLEREDVEFELGETTEEEQ